MTRWRPSGYPAPGAFAGAWMCRFRLCHIRDDGLQVVTLGHNVERGGRLAPMLPGFNFVSWVLMPATDREGDNIEIERAACNDAGTAEAQHLALLETYEKREIAR